MQDTFEKTGKNIDNLQTALKMPGPDARHHSVVIIGGGTAGITTAARLNRALKHADIAIIDPAASHYYQPLWTLVGGGVVEKEASHRLMKDVIPPGVNWIQDAVQAIYPDQNLVMTREGQVISYDYLVVCPGIQIDWDKVKGLKESLGKHGVCCNYSYKHVDYTWETLQNLKNGRALFTQPNSQVKCGGAPQKIMYLVADYLRKNNLSQDVQIEFFSPGEVIFGIEKFAKPLREAVKRYNIKLKFKHNLIAIRGPEQEADFEVTDEAGNVEIHTVHFDMIHAVPPMSAPDFIKQSPLADEEGWLDVDQYTLQHVRYDNVFGLGDAANLPTAKTGAAIRKQAPVLVKNMLDVMRHQEIRQAGKVQRLFLLPTGNRIWQTGSRRV